MDAKDTLSADAAADRLDRLAELSVRGGLAAAELELHAWRRERGCPAEARVMLAALLARRGEAEAARAVLVESLPRELETAEPEQLQLLISLYLAAGFTDAAERFGEVLGREAARAPAVRDWLAALELGGGVVEPGAKPQAILGAEVEHLAMQLRGSIGLVPTLVFAQKQEPHRASIALLRAALAAVEPALHFQRDHLMVCLALGELAILDEDYQEARRWAQRGLVLDPFNASLAMVLNQASVDPAETPVVVKALDDVLAKFPNYADVQAALIRREVTSGQRASAARRLNEWLEREPGSRLAQALQRELAA